jgi:hypothetical protein
VIQKNELYFCNQGSNVIQNQLSKSKHRLKSFVLQACVILYLKVKCYFILCKKTVNVLEDLNIQGVSEIRVLILTGERTRQFMKLFSITFCKIRKSIPRFFAPQFLPNESFCVIN